MKVILISPTNKASQRTKNRIREHGPKFQVEGEGQGELLENAGINWLLSSGKWLGWLPRNEFHIECVGKKFIEKVLG